MYVIYQLGLFCFQMIEIQMKWVYAKKKNLIVSVCVYMCVYVEGRRVHLLIELRIEGYSTLPDRFNSDVQTSSPDCLYLLLHLSFVCFILRNVLVKWWEALNLYSTSRAMPMQIELFWILFEVHHIQPLNQLITVTLLCKLQSSLVLYISQWDTGDPMRHRRGSFPNET